ncbi:hypothetical protein BDV95DRAFT_639751 [Massariosphaeria phaeospora]|uniref:Uncharacterized protein n=1 Tax=Massariosphaeria phaeospora TaxID=100035 RepID=A0A7C8M4S3_9PLEO|nr:hypothetical protein BDV95DRAFT_639751 [Massariosphaeria phaeospora]
MYEMAWDVDITLSPISPSSASKKRNAAQPDGTGTNTGAEDKVRVTEELVASGNSRAAALAEFAGKAKKIVVEKAIEALRTYLRRVGDAAYVRWAWARKRLADAANKYERERRDLMKEAREKDNDLPVMAGPPARAVFSLERKEKQKKKQKRMTERKEMKENKHKSEELQKIDPKRFTPPLTSPSALAEATTRTRPTSRRRRRSPAYYNGEPP